MAAPDRSQTGGVTNRVMTERPTITALVCLLLSTVVFYRQIPLTRQFSLLIEAEGVRQAYSWFESR